MGFATIARPLKAAALLLAGTCSTAHLPAVPLQAASLPTSFEFLGVTVVGAAPVDGAPVGGLSGLAWDPATGDYLAISDDRSELAPARLFRLKIQILGGRVADGSVGVSSVTLLRGAKGATYEPRSLDPEGIALSAGGFFVSSEGEGKKGIAPFVAEFEHNGKFVRQLPLPSRYLPRPDPRGGRGVLSGVRDNLGFEALTVSPDGRFLVAGVENGLAQESPAAAPGVPSVTRILRWDLERGGAAQEFLYRVEGVNLTPPEPTDFLVNGLVDLVALDESRFLALERQYVPGVGLSVRLYAAELAGLDDVATLDPPATAGLETARKTLLFDFEKLGIRLDNFEAMTFGPVLSDGRRSFFIVSDDNFNPAEQATFVLGFAVGFEPLAIADLQGAAHRSPLEGRFVAGVEGVVTATEDSRRDRGFWLESDRPDSDPATSEGIYVAWEGASTLTAGQRVRVGGRVEERGSGKNLPVTTLDLYSLEPLDEAASLPAPPKLGESIRIPAQVEDDGLTRFEPANDAIDLWESLESMRVEVPAGTVVGPTRSFGDIALLPDRSEVAVRSARGGVMFTAAGPDLDRLIVGRRISGAMPDLAVGDRVDRPFVAIVDYGFSSYRLQALAPLVTSSRSICNDRSLLRKKWRRQTLATVNVENLSISSVPDRIPKVGEYIASELNSPAIVVLEEIQDDSGSKDDGVVTSSATVVKLTQAISDAGGPTYSATWIDPEDGRDGGQPGGNIRVVFLFDSSRVQLIKRGNAGARDATAVVGTGRDASLTLSPGRIAPQSPAFDLTGGEGVRKSLAAEFRVGRKTLFVVANHLSSKYDDDRIYGARQPPVTPTGAKRLAQTKELRAFAELLLDANPQANLVILGDLNEPEWAEGVAGLSRPPLVNLIDRLPPGERYTYNFEGTSQAIDRSWSTSAASPTPPPSTPARSPGGGPPATPS